MFLKGRRQPTNDAAKLARAIYSTIEGMVPKAKAVCDFLEQIAKLYADQNRSLRWTTGAGLPVINRYYKPDIDRIPVWLDGRRRRVELVVGDTPEVAKGDAVNAVTANFTHSLDACHLHMVALEAAKEGIPLVTVHDCFGSIAPRMGRLLDIVRDEFVRLHKRHNFLAAVWASVRRNLPKHVKLLLPPEPGNLDLELVRRSHNAFR